MQGGVVSTAPNCTTALKEATLGKSPIRELRATRPSTRPARQASCLGRRAFASTLPAKLDRGGCRRRSGYRVGRLDRRSREQAGGPLEAPVGRQACRCRRRGPRAARPAPEPAPAPAAASPRARARRTRAGPARSPRLNANSESGISPLGRPTSASAPAKPKPCSRPKAPAIAQGKRRSRLVGAPGPRASSAASTKTLAAMASSISATGESHEPQHRQRERHAVPTREGGDGLDHGRQRGLARAAAGRARRAGDRGRSRCARRRGGGSRGPRRGARAARERRGRAAEPRSTAWTLTAVGELDPQQRVRGAGLEAPHADARTDEPGAPQRNPDRVDVDCERIIYDLASSYTADLASYALSSS